MEASSTPTPTPSNEPTLLSRLERLDVMMGYLEEIWNGKLRSGSCGFNVDVADGGGSLETSSPKRVVERRCLLPIKEAIVETKVKGSLIDRLHFLEQHVLELSLQTEEEIDSENKKKKREEERSRMHGGSKKSRGKKKKGTKKKT